MVPPALLANPSNEHLRRESNPRFRIESPASPRSTTEACSRRPWSRTRQLPAYQTGAFPRSPAVGISPGGIEPPSSTLAKWRSSAELRRVVIRFVALRRASTHEQVSPEAGFGRPGGATAARPCHARRGLVGEPGSPTEWSLEESNLDPVGASHVCWPLTPRPRESDRRDSNPACSAGNAACYLLTPRSRGTDGRNRTLS